MAFGIPTAEELKGMEVAGIQQFLDGIKGSLQTGEQTALNSLADRETQGLDWVTATLLPALDKMFDAKIDRIIGLKMTNTTTLTEGEKSA